jgi:triacylglycerol lipase
VPGIFYQSWAGLSNVFGIANPLDAGACGAMLFHPNTRHTMSPLLVAAVPFVAHGAEARPNDGFVTVDSARWGQFNGCIPADHIDELGMVSGVQLNPFTGFDHIRFYRNLAYDLSGRGL